MRSLNVFLTVDTEVWPRRSDWRATALRSDLDRDYNGRTRQGDFGIPFQLDSLERHGLKAVFFVESLCGSTVGLDRLREMVEPVVRRGQDVQLHVHTEWLGWMRPSILPGRRGRNLKDFSVDEQTVIIGHALKNLRDCGAPRVCAFRAGNYGADLETLDALRLNGIRYDTSYNYTYLDSACAMEMGEPVLQPREVRGVWEFPITFFRDLPTHHRHLQLVACSFDEISSVLGQAWEQGWSSVVIVSHSFELLKNHKSLGKPLLPDRIMVRRFERLCRFLAENRDRFRTSTFSELDPANPIEPGPPSPQILRSKLTRTASRYAEQLVRRLG